MKLITVFCLLVTIFRNGEHLVESTIEGCVGFDCAVTERQLGAQSADEGESDQAQRIH